MNKGPIIFMVWLVAVWQAWFLSAMGVDFLVPNLVLVLVILIALNRSTHFALAMAIWAGLWLDLASVSHFGLNIITYSLLVLAIVFVRSAGADFNFRPSLVAFSAISTILISASKLLTINPGVVGWGGLSAILFIWCSQAIITSLVMLLANEYLGRKFSAQKNLGMQL